MKTNLVLIVDLIWFSLFTASLAGQTVRNTSTTTQNGERVLRIETIVPVSPEKVWQALTTTEGWKGWAAPVAKVDFRIGGTIFTHYDSNAKIGSPGTIQIAIVNYLEREMITLKLKLTNQFPEKTRAEDQNLQEIVQVIAIDSDHTKVVSSMVGWGIGKEWDDVYNFFAKGNQWSYQQLFNFLSAKKQ
jgi:uncharacterized protein YndB with AHSA1/START domain